MSSITRNSAARLALVPAAGAVLVLLGACSVPATAPTAPSTAPGQGSGSTDAPVGIPTASVPADPADPAGGQQPSPSFSAPTVDVSGAAQTPTDEQPVSSRPGSFDETKVQLTMYPVRRAGQTATVNVFVTATQSGATFRIGDHLGDGDPETSSKALWAVDGLRLVDPSSRRMYLPAVTADGECVCSPKEGGILDSVPSTWITVTFAAPPAELSTIDVDVPSFGTFTAVPLR